ncbi:protein argonaute-3 isoform X2 [Drosophila hydei]|uniref:Protein argonaute-3 isoform X2 n=1 Tax=Drosophila hydei TaxID=7224 RepID=A0A6J2ST02_DROHY|nr:protein argonaute-3 isoform X2 [Drosophila hydei]
MSGRGNLLSLFHKMTETAEVSQSTQEHTNVRELYAEPSALREEYQRTAKNTTTIDLAASCNGLSISNGRGRANLLHFFKNDSYKIQNEKNKSDLSSSLEGLASQDQNKICTLKESTDLNSDINKNINPSILGSEFFCPNTIYGTKGSLVNLSCNYISLRSDPMKGIYLYEVRFSPAVDSLHLRMKYLNEHNKKFGDIKAFDGTTLYLPILLQSELTTFISKSFDNKDIEIRILFKKKESLKNCKQLYNILFDRVMKTLNYVKFDRKQFDPSRPKIIPTAKLEVWPGYVTAVDEYDGGLMLCCDVSHRLLCQRTVLDMLVEIYQNNKSNYQDKAKNYFVGSVIITRYNNRTYRIDDICFSQNPCSQFETRMGSNSYMDYYKNYHNITIKDAKQPLLISLKQSKKYSFSNTGNIQFCLIPELCYLTGLHDEIRADKKLMREIATFTSVTPNQRIIALNKYLKNVSENDDARKILENWGLSLQKNNDNIVGRRIGAELIYFAKQCVSAGLSAEFSKDAVRNEMLEIVHLNNWVMIHHKNDLKAAKSFLHNMQRCCEAFGMNIRKPNIISLENDRIDIYVDALRRNISTQTQIVVCICHTSRDDRYSAIKKICCSEIPVASQVINSKTLSNETKNRSIVQKIILQMNCKMGGSLWTVKIPFKNVMICGIDSYHDPYQKCNSVAAFVASLNSSYTQWFSKAAIQSEKEEIVNGLTSSFEAALECYKIRNGYLPDNVIIYRDGVGDGQLNLCAMYEIPQFERVCGKNMKITYLVIQKRNNTKFFLNNDNIYENPLPGTVVDKYITRSHMYDFFLVSQAVRHGTVSPMHFIVLRDDSNYGPDIIQKLSYKLCYLYYNWPGTVRIPACCMAKGSVTDPIHFF